MKFNTAKLVADAQEVRDQLRQLNDGKADVQANYIDFLLGMARETGSVEVSLVQGAMAGAERFRNQLLALTK